MAGTAARSLTLTLDEHTAALAAEALRGEADRRRRAARTVSAELVEKRRVDGTDIRTGAVQVVNVLAEADSLDVAATELAAAWEAGKPKTRRRSTRSSSTPPDASPPAEPDPADDDGDEHDDDLGIRDDDGATVIDHADDPDVAAARDALATSTAPTIPG